MRRSYYGQILIWVMLLGILFACSETLPINDVRSLGLRYSVKRMEEKLYHGHYQFDRIVADSLWQHNVYDFNFKGQFTLIKYMTVTKPVIDSAIICDTLAQQTIAKNNFTAATYQYLNDSLLLVNTYRDTELYTYAEHQYSDKKLIGIKHYWGHNDSLEHQSKFTYDTKKRMIKHAIYYADRNCEIRYLYSWTSKKVTYSDRYLCEKLFFNIHHQLTEKHYFMGEKALSIAYYTYNTHGDVTSIHHKDLTSLVTDETQYSYQYDSRFNWIEKITQCADGTILLSTRKIDYYN